MSDANKAIVRGYLEAAWVKKDLAGLDKFVATDRVSQGPMTNELPPGVEGDRAFVGGMIAAFPDVMCQIDRQESQGDTVHTWVTYHGTNTGSLMGMPPTGKKATVKVKFTDRIANGKIVETVSEWDAQDMMRQLGLG